MRLTKTLVGKLLFLFATLLGFLGMSKKPTNPAPTGADAVAAPNAQPSPKPTHDPDYCPPCGKG